MNDDLIIKGIDDAFTDYRNSMCTLSQRCHCYIDEVMESRRFIRFNSENRELDFPEVVSGDTTMKICGLSKNLDAIHLISASRNEVTQITLDSVNIYSLYAICCEIKDALEKESTNYILNHNKEYLKDIKENDQEFVQDIVEAYKHYEIRISKMYAKDVLNEFSFGNEKDSIDVEEGSKKDVILPFNAHRNATCEHKFDWEQMTFYVVFLEDRAYITPFVKIVDYDSQDGNDVILKIENDEVIAQ